MPGQTPYRGYPFPQDPDRIDVAGDIERLARAVDTDNNAILGIANGSRDLLPLSIPSVGISSGNVVGEVEIGSFTLPNSPFLRNWYFWWYLGVTGHSEAGVIQQKLKNDAGVDISAGLLDGYTALIPMTMMLVGRLTHQPNSGAVTYHCWVNVTGGGSAPNVNINGGVMFLGI